MFANIITLSRLLLTFVVISVFGWSRPVDIAVIFTIAGIFILDALDGIVARQRDETSKLGEVLDTLADRIVENTFWIYFTASGHLNVLMPIAVMVRGFITDSLQRFWGYPKSGWRYALTRSRPSRALSGLTKMLAFTSLAGAQVFTNSVLDTASLVLASIAIGVCLLRGLPFFFTRLRTQTEKQKHRAPENGDRNLIARD
ncbi:CDP-alcohol phosphatidyltransferase family protein [Candidatus Poribacteria bacterium]|nr:CDP-alcohol phosphatidyltransferase family protein [Candidatus Poribacteria bacterium]